MYNKPGGFIVRQRSDSYVKGVKPLENKKWTKQERKYVLTLKDKGVKRSHIAKMLDVTTTQIDNQLRMTRKMLLRKCFVCGSPIKKCEKPTLCPKCRNLTTDYKAARRKELLAEGLCGVCGLRPPKKGKRCCKRCISGTQRRRLAKGLCAACGKRPVRPQPSMSHRNKKALCTVCARTMRKARAKRMLEKRKTAA